MVDCREGFGKNEKYELEVEVEKVVKAQKEAQSAADREEPIAHNKESRTRSSTRRARRSTSRKWKLNSRRSVMTSSLSQEPHPIGQKDCRSVRSSEGKKPAHRRPSAKDAQEVIRVEQVDFEQVAEKRQACDVAKNETNLAKQSDLSKNTQYNVK